MQRPGIDEYDAGSYLEGSIGEFDVLEMAQGGLRVDTAPSYRHPDILGHDLCRDHAFDLAREFGYAGPLNLPIAYKHSDFELEPVMILASGLKTVSIASYAYGRAYFEPGEPRTIPCEKCGRETLVDNDSWV